MRFLFLRGKIEGTSRHKQLIESPDSYTDVFEDMWSELFYKLCCELRVQGDFVCHASENRVFSSDIRMSEYWIREERIGSWNFHNPDIIFFRSERPYFRSFIRRFPNATKVYYGAGPHYYPMLEFKNYDVILADSLKQLSAIKSKSAKYDSRSVASMFIKPCASIIKKVDAEKEYDVLFVSASDTATRKQHKLLFNQLSNSGLKVLCIGRTNDELVEMAKEKNVDVTWSGFIRLKDVPREACKCRVYVCCSNEEDSAPQSIIESLAMDIPVVVTNRVSLWKEKYITPRTGLIVKENGILRGIESVLGSIEYFSTAKYYDDNLCMDLAVSNLASLISEVGGG